MTTINSNKDKTELLQPAWLSVAALFAACGTLCKEVLKTVFWFPWALYELMRGYLGPDVRNILLLSSVGVCFLGVIWHYVSSMLMLDPQTVQYQNMFFYSGSVAIYLVIGFVTRNSAKRYDLLK